MWKGKREGRKEGLVIIIMIYNHIPHIFTNGYTGTGNILMRKHSSGSLTGTDLRVTTHQLELTPVGYSS